MPHSDSEIKYVWFYIIMYIIRIVLFKHNMYSLIFLKNLLK